jgi:hypothetical protein
MVGEAVWAFDYRKSQFTWSRLHLNAEVPFGTSGPVAADLVNGTGAPVEFAFTELPDWVDSAVPETGTIPAGETLEVSFVIAEGQAEGSYSEEITALALDASLGRALFDLNVDISCHEPEWEVDPGLFEHTMTIVAEVDVADQESDMLAAFVGNQLRGVAPIQHNGAVNRDLAYLTVFSNRLEGETVRFQVWDDSECKLYNATLESFPFVANGSLGTMDIPEPLTATEVSGEGSLTATCNAGWTWLSTNMLSADMSCNAVLADLNPADGDLIKSQTEFSQFGGQSWEGGLLDLDNVSGYMIRLSEVGTVYHSGAVAPIDTPVPVQEGWNWIGYLPEGPQDVTPALGDLQSRNLVSDYDIIKSQTGFAEYRGGYWYGSLDSLRVGGGYKLHLQAQVDSSFTYSPYVPSAPMTLATKDMTPEKLDTTPDWSVNAGQYQHNMTVTAVLQIDGTESVDQRDMVGAFAGQECRGVARPVYIASLGRYVVFLMLHSNDAGGERLELRAFDADGLTIYDISEELTFQADQVHGNLSTPVILNAAEVHGDDNPVVPRVFGLGQNRPNPFNPTTDIDYDVPASGGRVSIRVYDLAGRLVRTLVDADQAPGRKTVTWYGRDDRGRSVATGMYFYRMKAPGFSKTRKLTLIR